MAKGLATTSLPIEKAVVADLTRKLGRYDEFWTGKAASGDAENALPASPSSKPSQQA